MLSHSSSNLDLVETLLDERDSQNAVSPKQSRATSAFANFPNYTLLPSKEEEAAMVFAAKLNKPGAKDALIAALTPFIKSSLGSFVSLYKAHDLEEDIFQLAIIRTLEALNDFDATRSRFSTFLRYSLCFHLHDTLANVSIPVKIPLTRDTLNVYRHFRDMLIAHEGFYDKDTLISCTAAYYNICEDACERLYVLAQEERGHTCPTTLNFQVETTPPCEKRLVITLIHKAMDKMSPKQAMTYTRFLSQILRGLDPIGFQSREAKAQGISTSRIAQIMERCNTIIKDEFVSHNIHGLDDILMTS